ncbi:hypothetical protein EJB05_21121 [Eragrostis curvula]|uniref:Uncharacterized protein n=1 Tax=Eragrostis curvula TaxID=38414 RepID=A0A5J9V2F7_9POAL|nr:hypothetical protein EJB05_21121 [Eragrostis curvula]
MAPASLLHLPSGRGMASPQFDAAYMSSIKDEIMRSSFIVEGSLIDAKGGDKLEAATAHLARKLFKAKSCVAKSKILSSFLKK